MEISQNTVLLPYSICSRFCVCFSFPPSSKSSAVFHHPLTTYILFSANSKHCHFRCLLGIQRALKILVIYQKNPKNSKTTYVQLQTSKSGSCLLLQDGTASLPYSSLLQRTHFPWEEEDQDRSSTFFYKVQVHVSHFWGKHNLDWNQFHISVPKSGGFTDKCPSESSSKNLSNTQFWS